MKDKQACRQFVDTNIILYAYDRSDPVKQRKAAGLLRVLWDSGLGHVSIQVLQELYVNLTRKVSNCLPPDRAKQIVSDLGRWRHHVPDLDSLIEAVDIEHRFGISFWDAMIVSSALKLKCAFLWTEDLNHGQDYSGVKALNPFVTDKI